MDYTKALIAAGLQMKDSGLTVATWGNVSLRNPRTGKIYLSPSAMAYDSLRPEDIVVLDASGNLLQGYRKPTIEKDLHVAIYRQRPDVNAILHTHPVDSTVFACLGWELPLITDEAVSTLVEPVKVAGYGIPGTKALAQNCLDALGEKGRACLLQSHGAVCVGNTMADAFKTSQVLELTANIYWRVKALGEPRRYSPQEEKALAEMAQDYGQPGEKTL